MNSQLLNEQKQLLADVFRNSTIMISGSTGLIGSGVVRFLMNLNDCYDASISIIALYRNDEKKKEKYKDYLEREDLRFLYYSDENTIDFSIKVDYIIHASGISGGSKTHLQDPLRVFSVGINGTEQLLEYAVTHKSKGFLYVSTYEVYGEIDSKEPIREDYPCSLNSMSLRSSYAEVKRVCESLLVAYNAKYGLNVYSARISPTFGAGVDYNDSRFFAEFGRCIVEKRDIVLKTLGKTVRNYLDVDDAASAFLYILANGNSNDAYNVTNADNVLSIKDIANVFIKESMDDIKLMFDVSEDIKKNGFRKEGYITLSIEKLKKTGWAAAYNFNDTVEKMLNHFKEVR